MSSPEPTEPAGPPPGRSVRRRLPVEALLALPVLALIWPPLYNRAEPAVLGVPFFYAYQLALIPLTATCLVLVHRTRQCDRQREGKRDRSRDGTRDRRPPH